MRVKFSDRSPKFAISYFSIYSFYVAIAIGINGKRLAAKITKATGTPLSDDAVATLKSCKESGHRAKVITLQSGGLSTYVIMADRFEWTTSDIAYLAHETLHVAIDVLHNVSIPLVDGAPNEALTYLHDDVFTWGMKKILGKADTNDHAHK